MNFLKSCLHWTHRIFWYSVAGLIIATAIAISLIRIFIPDVKEYREHIEQVASSFLGQEVHIKSMDARLSGFTPTIIFRDVSMLDDTGKHEIIHFSEARLGLDFWHSFKVRKLIPSSLTLYGVNLGITMRKDRSLVFRGLDLKKIEQQITSESAAIDRESSELARWLFERSTLSLKRSTVVWYDARHAGSRLRFNDVNFEIRNDGDRHQFTGDVILPVKMGNSLSMSFDFQGNILNPAEWQGSFYTHGSLLKIADWGIKPSFHQMTLDSGVLDVDLWGRWQGGKVVALSTKLAGMNFRFKLPGHNQPVALNKFSGLFDWQRKDSGWRLNVNRLQMTGDAVNWPESTMRVIYDEPSAGVRKLQAFSSYLHVGNSIALLNKLKLLDMQQQKFLNRLAPDGELRDLSLSYLSGGDIAPEYSISGEFTDLSVNAYDRFPGVKGLDGSLSMNQQHGELNVSDNSVQLNLPRLFRKPFALTHLQGKVQWWHAFGAWHVTSSQLDIDSGDVSTNLAMNLGIPDNKKSPFMDLQVGFSDGNANQAWRYLPVSIMHSSLVDWLDNSLSGGHVTQGKALFQGRLSDFPFTDKAGTFVVDFNAKDVLLNYHKGWPPITAGDLVARFTGRGMALRAEHGVLYDSRLRDVRVNIERFNLPVLSIKGKFEGPSDNAFRFLVDSPVVPGARNFYQNSKTSGTMQGEVSLTLPLDDDAALKHPADYKGYVALKDSGLSAWGNRLVVNHLGGRIDFARTGVSSSGLQGQFSGQPVKFMVYTRGSAKQSQIEISMTGGLDVAKLPDGLTLGGLRKHFSGKTDWQGVLSFGHDTPDSNVAVKLNINSRMQGLALDFPAPLHKSPESIQDFQLDMQIASDDTIDVGAKLGNTLNAALRMHSGKDSPVRLEKAVLQFSTQPAKLPEANSLVIRGGIPHFPIDAWQLIKNQLSDHSKVSNLDEFGLPLILDMDYLNVVTSEESPDTPEEDPRNVALINGDIRNLVYDGMQLGHFHIQTSRQEDGIHFDKLKLDSPRFKLDGEGSWFLRQGEQHTNLLLTLKSENVGAMITSLGYKGVVKDAKGRAVFQLNWPDAPNRFEYTKLNGIMGIVINDGIISDVEPGAGRLVGLLSLSELPRHLALDFSDFRSGLKFKQIVAQFNIVDGNAFTKNLHIISPAALIDITGRTGLAARDYDLKISVAPNVSKTLPVISWLAWGGQVGALTFLMDQIFGSEFNKSIATSYKITGSWDKPDVKVLPPPKPEDKQQTK